MRQPVVVFVRRHTTAYVLIHVLRHLLTCYPERVRGRHFHVVADDRRDLDLVRSLLPGDRVSVEAQYEMLRPFRRGRVWPAETVERWERLYGDPNLRIYIDNERALVGRREEVKWRYLLSHIEYYEALWKRVRPVLFVSGAADGLLPWTAMAVFRGNGVPCLSINPCRFELRSFVLDNPHEILGIAAKYRKILVAGLDPETEQQARRLQNEYRMGGVKPLDHIALQRVARRRVLNPLVALPLIWESCFTDAGNFEQPLWEMLGRAVRARRTWWHNRYLSRRTVRGPGEGEKFFFFPLQLEPESSLSTQGRGWKDQIEVIRLISNSLPIDRCLYVKEHPSMLSGIRPLSFYREIMSLSRVRLLNQKTKTAAIIRSAEAVLTVTGTTGWEALMFLRPVVLFGHAFYEEFEEGVTIVDRVEILPGILLDLRHRQVPEKALLAYIAAVLESAPEGIISEPRYLPSVEPVVMDKGNLDKLARIILSRLEGTAA